MFKKTYINILRELQSLAQTGLAFSSDNYDVQRYKRINEIVAEIIADNSNLDFNQLNDLLLEQPGYATPKIDVRSAIINKGKILLVQEKMDNKWAMPGGWADVGDYPSEVAIRETLEEAGVEVRPIKIIGVFDANRTGRPMQFFHAFKIVFLCEYVSGELRASDETLDVKYFDFEKLPEFSENRTNMKHINVIKKHLTSPDYPTYFD